MRVRMVATLTCAALCWAAADGFEVASVKPNLANDRIVIGKLKAHAPNHLCWISIVQISLSYRAMVK